MREPDVAMYQAKTRRTGTEFYARERDLHTRERLQLIGELRDAVARETLTLHHQPKLDLGRNRITGVEALVRWPHPEHGMVPPDEFIPLAEQTGVIGPLTELVIRKALRQAADWTARGIMLSMAVNVSATNLLEDGWTAGVLAALERHGVRADRFVVEITEDVLMTDPDRSLTALAALSAAACASRSTTSARATRRCPTSAGCPSTSSRSTARSCSGWAPTRPGGIVLRLDDEHVERARPVDALHAVQLDVAGRRRA
ncbi:MAG TPA: EAL domain-containing protein [Solirubrobacteraceae bacterium]|nr:EAL domain-containing protein [Solirubrobacteraceae bacterium]